MRTRPKGSFRMKAESSCVAWAGAGDEIKCSAPRPLGSQLHPEGPPCRSKYPLSPCPPQPDQLTRFLGTCSSFIQARRFLRARVISPWLMATSDSSDSKADCGEVGGVRVGQESQSQQEGTASSRQGLLPQLIHSFSFVHSLTPCSVRASCLRCCLCKTEGPALGPTLQGVVGPCEGENTDGSIRMWPR